MSSIKVHVQGQVVDTNRPKKIAKQGKSSSASEMKETAELKNLKIESTMWQEKQPREREDRLGAKRSGPARWTSCATSAVAIIQGPVFLSAIATVKERGGGGKSR